MTAMLHEVCCCLILKTVSVNSHSRYEDGDTTLRKVSSAVDFIWSDTPLEILGSVTAISFDDPACVPIKEHELTTEEVDISLFFFLVLIFSPYCFTFMYSQVKHLCEDLRVLGKQDFKHLLKYDSSSFCCSKISLITNCSLVIL